jgi:hypothetical protein
VSFAKRSPLLIAIILGVAVSSLVLVGLGWSVIRAGVFEVSVHEGGPDGNDFTLYVPAAFVQAALRLVPDAIFADIRSELDREIGNQWPLLLAAARELDKCPDCTLVRVESGREFVRVRKEGGSYRVDVSDGDESVRVILPEDFLSKVIREVAPKRDQLGSIEI